MQIQKHIPQINSDHKTWILIIILFIAHHILSASYNPPITVNVAEIEEDTTLYLIDLASRFTLKIDTFEKSVKHYSAMLNHPPEWTMAVLHSESKFDASAINKKGSKATGLIQWMPDTAKEYGLTIDIIRNMNHVEQMEYVYLYLKKMTKRNGKYKTLTDLYLAVLYPAAINKPNSYVLYSKPSKRYTQNIGLDFNNDGKVTVDDVRNRMLDRYPEAYNIKI